MILIDVPDHNFLLVALLIKQYFSDEEVYLVPRSISRTNEIWYEKTPLKEKVKFLNLDAMKQNDLFEGKKIEYIIMHHANSYRVNLEERVTALVSSSCSLTISLYPDGIANYMQPRPFNHEFFEALSSNITFGSFYSFGIKRTVIPEAFSKKQFKAKTIPIDKVAQIATNLMQYVNYPADTFWHSISEKLNESGKKKISIIMLRNWCAPGYGNKYNFGDGTDTLEKIYDNLVNTIYSNDEVLFLIRDDSRSRTTHPKLVEKLSARLDTFSDVIMIPNDFPKYLNFEFFLCSMPDHIKEDIRIDMIALDSLSGFFIPFFAANGEVIMGASNQFIESHGASEEQIIGIGNNVKARAKNISAAWNYAIEAQHNISFQSNEQDGILKLSFNSKCF